MKFLPKVEDAEIIYKKAVALNNPFVDSELVWETATLLTEVVQSLNINITLHWLKGHNNHQGNEIVDRLAALATQLPTKVLDQT